MDSGGDYITSIIEETKKSGELAKVFNNNDVFYVVMNSGDNTFNNDFVQAMEKAYGSVHDSGDLTGCAMVTLSTNPKIFSNGMDLVNIPSPDELGELFKKCGVLLGKLLASGMPTIAMINGHAFAAGLYFALCHDYLIMRDDRGYLCFNENQFGAPVNKYNAVLATSKIGKRNYHEMYLHFIKVSAQEAVKRGIVHLTAGPKEINQVTQDYAEKVQNYNTDSKTFAMTKNDIYQDAIHSLTVDQGINGYAIEKIFAYKAMIAKM